ncbi:hypothetical protein UFOVP23_16 [uncultured Caudovirales phage]|uniref:Uncharacterized protein n=1 Tax=uncultured Caudovirales phage TaxID=2100421 RepID=A0A6J5TBB4_9CAUD|nr:hypothetical protein UFOVP23_16 [uncultured Caudovirales phage]
MNRPGITVHHGNGKETFHPIDEAGLYVLQVVKVNDDCEKLETQVNAITYFEIGLELKE